MPLFGALCQKPLYEYVAQNPVNKTDPKGLRSTVDAYCQKYPESCAEMVEDGTLPTPVPLVPPKEDDEECKKCEPCKTVSGRIVPVGTIGYRPLDVLPDDVVQHGVSGSHHNIFIAQQNPNNCQCFWQKQSYVLKPEDLPADAIPIEPFIN